MPKTRGLEKAAAKWRDRVAVAGTDYEEGVKAPRTDWKAASKEAEKRYEEGVQSAMKDKRFGSGVDKAGTEKWQRKTVELGARRWPEGVRAAEGDFKDGMAKVITAIEGATLPPRFPAGDPRNLERVKAITEAVRKAVKGK